MKSASETVNQAVAPDAEKATSPSFSPKKKRLHETDPGLYVCLSMNVDGVISAQFGRWDEDPIVLSGFESLLEAALFVMGHGFDPLPYIRDQFKEWTHETLPEEPADGEQLILI